MVERVAKVRLEAVTSSYRQEMDKAAASTEGLLTKTSKLDGVGQKMQSVGSSMTRGLTLPLVAAMGLATKSASDLQQAVGGTGAVFGEAADAIDEYAKKAASASGLSEREFREATTSIGGQLKRMTGDVDLAAEQSVQLTEVAADLAATYGGTTADAVAALGSAFRGEADPAERFNLNLKIGAVNAKAVELGLAATTASVDDNARAQATLALIMEQSSDAQGQFAREAGSAAGSMQIAKAEMENASAEIGAVLLPALAQAAGGIADVARVFSELPANVQNGILAFAGLVALAGPVMGFTGKLMDMNGRLRDSEGALTRTGRVAKGFGMTLGGLGIAAMAIEFHKWAESMSALNTEASKLEGAGMDEVGHALKEILESAWGRSSGYEPRALELVTKSLTRMAEESPAVVEQMIAVAETADGGLARAMENASITVDDLRGALDAGIQSQVRTQEVQERSTEIVEDATGATEVQTEVVEKSISAQERLESAIKNVSDALKAQFDPLIAAQDALLNNAEAHDKVTEAERKLAEAQAVLTWQVTEFGRKSPEAAAAARDVMQATQELDGANRDAVRSAMDVTTATSELALKMREGEVDIDGARGTLAMWVEQGLITEEQARQVAGELESVAGKADSLTGRNIVIPISADTSRFEWAIGQLYSKVTPGVTIGVGDAGGPIMFEKKLGGPIPGPTGQPVYGLAHGGEYVLSADVVNAIKNGKPSAGLPALARSTDTSGASAAGSSLQINGLVVNYPTQESVGDSLMRATRKAAALMGG